MIMVIVISLPWFAIGRFLHLSFVQPFNVFEKSKHIYLVLHIQFV